MTIDANPPRLARPRWYNHTLCGHCPLDPIHLDMYPETSWPLKTIWHPHNATTDGGVLIGDSVKRIGDPSTITHRRLYLRERVPYKHRMEYSQYTEDIYAYDLKITRGHWRKQRRYNPDFGHVRLYGRQLNRSDKTESPSGGKWAPEYEPVVMHAGEPVQHYRIKTTLPWKQRVRKHSSILAVYEGEPRKFDAVPDDFAYYERSRQDGNGGGDGLDIDYGTTVDRVVQIGAPIIDDPDTLAGIVERSGVADARELLGVYRGHWLTFVTGANQGWRTKVETYEHFQEHWRDPPWKVTFVLTDAPPHPLEEGDEFVLTRITHRRMHTRSERLWRRTFRADQFHMFASNYGDSPLVTKLGNIHAAPHTLRLEWHPDPEWRWSYPGFDYGYDLANGYHYLWPTGVSYIPREQDDSTGTPITNPWYVLPPEVFRATICREDGGMRMASVAVRQDVTDPDESYAPIWTMRREPVTTHRRYRNGSQADKTECLNHYIEYGTRIMSIPVIGGAWAGTMIDIYVCGYWWDLWQLGTFHPIPAQALYADSDTESYFGAAWAPDGLITPGVLMLSYCALHRDLPVQPNGWGGLSKLGEYWEDYGVGNDPTLYPARLEYNIFWGGYISDIGTGREWDAGYGAVATPFGPFWGTTYDWDDHPANYHHAYVGPCSALWQYMLQGFGGDEWLEIDPEQNSNYIAGPNGPGGYAAPAYKMRFRVT